MTVVRCPQCGKETEFEGNEHRPFCSERCKLLDLGAWADEEYGIAADPTEISERDLDELERALENEDK